ncbi:porin [Iodidimonas sp. SYSU 1G8]|uniref:porin n=1 Tax=Iodidimonas sp. SYSU 1G8 TaxID=3133967 RepID=UPI0031FE877E
MPIKKTLKTGLLAVAGAAAMLVSTAPAHAGYKMEIDDTKWVSIGAGVRTSFNAIEDGAPDGSWSTNFDLDSARLYLNGQVHKWIKLEFNTEIDGDDDIHIMDAIVKFEFNDYFNVWAGRFLPPSDRANLSGPYYANVWGFPMVQGYPAIFAGRDNGLAIWGQTGGGKFKWQVGVFEGCSSGKNSCSKSGDVFPTKSYSSDSPLFAARLVYNFLDPEPGYYNSSTYYGTKDILAVGLTFMHQAKATGDTLLWGDYTAWSVDVLFEKPVGNGGAISLEGAYYNYDADGLDTTLIDGEGFFVQGAYLFPGKIGFGQFQPVIRYQQLDRDDAIPDSKKWDGGLNYIIDGHNARLSIMYGHEDRKIGPSIDSIVVGVQLQI